MTNKITTLTQDPRTLSDYRERSDKIFDYMDIDEDSRKDYKARIGFFLDYVNAKVFDN